MEEQPADYTPLPTPIAPRSILNALLKHPAQLAWEMTSGRAGRTIGILAFLATVSLLIYGLIAGTLSSGQQLWIAPVKVLTGTAMAAGICLPSLFVFLCMSGADAHFKQVAGFLVASVSLLGVLLLSLSPIVWVFSQSTDSLAFMGFIHLLLWLIAVLFSVRLLGRCARTAFPGAKPGLAAWVLVYILVSLQMMTTLRPILGRADTFLPAEKQFFLIHWLETLKNENPPAGQNPYL